jgi:D-alanyl-D-alanine dipeptidase
LTRDSRLATGAVILAALLSRTSTAQIPPSLQQAQQLIVVTTQNWAAVSGTLHVFDRGPDGRWVSAGADTRIVVGKSGMGWGRGLVPVTGFAGPMKQEGDGRAPAGAFALGTAFGYAPADSARWLRLPYVQATGALECVDDPASRWYNQVLLRQSATPAPDWHSSEIMRLTSDQYKWGVVVNHNVEPTQPGDGSCIFMHIWSQEGAGTVGCTAMAERNLRVVMQWLDPRRTPVLVQLTQNQYRRLRESWGLP